MERVGLASVRAGACIRNLSLSLETAGRLEVATDKAGSVLFLGGRRRSVRDGGAVVRRGALRCRGGEAGEAGEVGHMIQSVRLAIE